MKKEIKSDMLSRYIEEIGSQLPKQGKQDILNEIRSLIMDTLEDRAEANSKPVDNALTVEVLKEFGSPEKMALQYGKSNYLIGPRYFSMYTQILRIVITVVIGISLVSFGFSLAETDLSSLSLISTLIEVFAGVISAVFQTFGVITLIFWGIERTTPGIGKIREDHWKPEDLLENEADSRVKIGEHVTDIVFTVIGLIVFNFFQRYLGLVTFSPPENQWQLFPILTNAFSRYLPYINAFWIASIILNLYILNRGVMDKIAHWGKVVLDMASLGILFAIVTGPAILNLTNNGPVNSIYQGLLAALPELNAILNILLTLAMVGILVKIIFQVYRLIFRKADLPIEEIIESIENIDKK